MRTPWLAVAMGLAGISLVGGAVFENGPEQGSQSLRIYPNQCHNIRKRGAKKKKKKKKGQRVWGERKGK
jgi:hypothetical protein